MAKSIIISLIQCEILPELEKVDANVAQMIEYARKDNPDLIMLPEKWRSVYPKEQFYETIEKERGHSYKLLKDLAIQHEVYIITGGIWEERENKSRFITSYVFDTHGKEVGRQDKLHLYSYEPSIFTPGTCLNIFTHDPTNTQFTVLICFDVAFFETPRLAVEEGAELLLSPTLIRSDGVYNWNIYLQARALENRVPIAACNPVGNLFGNTYLGQSKIISFKRGHHSPSILNVNECDMSKQAILTQKINISFPNTLRKARLAEQRDKSSIKIVKS